VGNSLGKIRAKGRFLQIEADWFESPAYRDLSMTARNLLTEFLDIFRPGRNGELSISTRRAADRLSVSENTCIKAFRELVEHGFLILTHHENWIQGQARKFELTVRPMDNRTQKDSWKKWEAGKPVSKLPEKKKSRPQKLRLSA
jgi:hypothetical protein